MEAPNASLSNFDLWLIIARIHHDVVMVRQKELSPYHIPPRRLQVLRVIQALGVNATLSNIAKEVERKSDVISRQAVSMEKDGLIRRIQDTPKSRLLRIELTHKGREMLDISKDSKILDSAWSFLGPDERKEVHEVLNRMLMQLRKQLPV